MGDLTRNFSRWEFACRCGCGLDDIRMELVEMFQIARDILGEPINITNGIRCPVHNLAVGGKPDSSHPPGWAADAEIPRPSDRYRYYHAFHKAGFRRFGHGHGFMHGDCDPNKPSPRIWLY